MNDYLVFDIETVKNPEADLFFSMGLGKVSSRLKDPAKISAEIEKQKTKCALHWWTGKVCMISTELHCENKFRQWPYASETMTFHNNFEYKLLKDFGNYLLDIEGDLVQINLIGKNSKGFDLPFLVGRYLRHDIGVPSALRSKRILKDIDEMFSHWGDKSQITNLNNYAFGIGIDGKTDGAGASMVQSWHDLENWTEMKKYCERDKDIVVEMLKRYRPFERIQ